MTLKKEKKTDYKRVFQFAFTTYCQFPWLATGALISRLLSTIILLIPPLYYKEIIDLLSSTTGIQEEIMLHTI